MTLMRVKIVDLSTLGKLHLIMVEKFLKRIAEAETEASRVLKDAENAVRKIEERNYAEIEKLRNEMNMEIIKAVKEIEKAATANAEENITFSLSEPSQQKIKAAKEFIIDAIIGGTI